MKIEKAIEILDGDLTYTYPARFDDLQKAIKLGIEALKEIEYLRESQLLVTDELLPGETEESSQEAEEINPEPTNP